MQFPPLTPALQALQTDLCNGCTTMINRPLDLVAAAVIIPHERRIDVFLAEWLKITFHADGSASLGYNPVARAEEPGFDMAVEGSFYHVPLAGLLDNLQQSEQVDARICTAIHSLLKEN